MTRTILLAAAALGLAACQGSAPHTAVSPQHVPTVTQTLLTHDLTYTNASMFQPGELAELDEWLTSVDLAYGDRISVDDPNPVAADARRTLIAEVVGQRGLMVQESGPMTNPPLPRGVTRVVVVRSVASVPACPDGSRVSNPNLDNGTTSNFTCAIASNISAMVADPNDLISGKPYKGSVANTADVAGAVDANASQQN